MIKIHRLIRFFIFTSLVVFSVNVNADLIKIGLRAHSGVSKGLAQWQKTADYLSHKFPEHKFIMVPFVGLKELMNAVSREEFDFVLTNPSSSIEMEIRFGVTQMVTLKNLRQGKPYTRFGSVIFTRSDHASINSITDLKGKSFVAVSERAFGGWRVAKRELLKKGFNPDKEFSSMEFSGGIQEDVVYSILSGNFDAGVVRTDMLERMASRGDINLKNIRIINNKKIDGFPFLLSTDLYPEWPFCKMKKTPSNLAQKVALALLTIPKNHPAAISGKYAGWTVAENYQPVRELMRDLQVGPYKDYNKFNFQTIFQKYFIWIIVFSLFLIFMAIFLVYSAISNRKLSNEKHLQNSANAQLTERVKELNCLYNISSILDATKDPKSGFNCVVSLLPESLQYPELASACIKYKDREYKTYPFKKSLLKLSSTITESKKVIGEIVVYYSDDAAKHDVGPFLKEEVLLVDEIAKRLSTFLDRLYSENALQEAKFSLEQRVMERTQELTVAKNAAEKANFAKTDFLSKMSHELRTPLNAILGFAQLLLIDEKNTMSSNGYDNIQEIHTAGEHLLELINDMLDLSRIESGNYAIQLEDTNIDDVVQESLALLENTAQKKHIKLIKEFDQKLKPLNTDRRALKQILINLLSNAVKYSNPDGLVTVKIEYTQKSTLTLSVLDTGPGIPDDKREDLFNPFVRLERDYGIDGAGIGLSVVKGLAELLSGSVGVESVKDRGSRFWIQLPLTIPQSHVALAK